MDENAQLKEPQADYGTASAEAPPQLQMTPALECLAKLGQLEVQEKASLIEGLTAALGMEIEMANRYKVLAGEDAHEIFYAVEETDFFTRNVKQCLPDCAPWNVKVLYTKGGGNDVAFSMSRPWTCTCCCFNRPTMEVLDVQSNQKLGSVRDPFACCDLTFGIKDAGDNDVIAVKAGCCQPGLICPLPCGPCSKVTFKLEKAESGEELGTLTKKVPSCLKWVFASDVDNYKLDMAGVEDPRYKALLLALTIFVDFRYYNDNSMDA
mmetsp:Transcript_63489/g.176010  ORF Transcript_63489/g.176010 Transcript_63489/m.176010 type:complete len:265 (+) Transcript_63489:88-882(+)